ncbi:ferritin-like domain-containing protein [Roridomyces roridus]|uniref:Ferritin-like domain-containing protein n=1 Tax=Roridomyces roridus TaxID=1738132 RepID=A0AAD7CEC7_9AGAR|nr:ferritin-like domain-containing protein [Roridomyces roridus]
MKFTIQLASALAAVAPLVQLAKAGPVLKRDTNITDPQVLNYALTLEHLEAAFYKEGLSNFSAADFAAAGYPDWIYGRLGQIRDHEATHVQFLTTALQTAGAQAVNACTYNFPVSDIKSFVSLAATLESVGSTAYTGGAAFISNKDYLTAAASILTVEGRHTAWINSAILHGAAWDTAFQTPLGLNAVYTLAAQFITSCPDGNAASLPTLTPYPSLTLEGKPGSTGTLTFSAQNNGSLFVAFASGIGAPAFQPIHNDSKVDIPSDLRGYVFAFVTSSNGTLDDSTTVAGPAILDVGFDASGNVV